MTTSSRAVTAASVEWLTCSAGLTPMFPSYPTVQARASCLPEGKSTHDPRTTT